MCISPVGGSRPPARRAYASGRRAREWLVESSALSPDGKGRRPQSRRVRLLAARGASAPAASSACATCALGAVQRLRVGRRADRRNWKTKGRLPLHFCEIHTIKLFNSHFRPRKHISKTKKTTIFSILKKNRRLAWPDRICSITCGNSGYDIQSHSTSGMSSAALHLIPAGHGVGSGFIPDRPSTGY